MIKKTIAIYAATAVIATCSATELAGGIHVPDGYINTNKPLNTKRNYCKMSALVMQAGVMGAREGIPIQEGYERVARAAVQMDWNEKQYAYAARRYAIGYDASTKFPAAKKLPMSTIGLAASRCEEDFDSLSDNK